MFTGIIETIGIVKDIKRTENNITFGVQSAISNKLKIDQSIAHDGVCLTVIKIEDDMHYVTAIDETLSKTCLQQWEIGSAINLERAMLNNARLDGHFVQGHVDSTAICTSIENRQGSWLYQFSFDAGFAALMIEKGSVCINGTSLTCFGLTNSTFVVAIIPYTYQHTNFHDLKIGGNVNIEFDILGKYIARRLQIEELSKTN
jgi:riboflavin synthase